MSQDGIRWPDNIPFSQECEISTIDIIYRSTEFLFQILNSASEGGSLKEVIQIPSDQPVAARNLNHAASEGADSDDGMKGPSSIADEVQHAAAWERAERQ